MKSKISLKVASIIVTALMILQMFMPIFVYATDNIVATNYRVTDGYIINIEAGETVANVLENVSSTTGEQCLIYSGNVLASNTDTVYTGMTLRVGNSTYTLVVAGDVNGDGRVSVSDLSTVMSAVVKLRTLNGAYFKAADLNRNGELTGDGRITASDESILMMKIVGLEVPDVNERNVSDDITINVSTTAPAKSVKVSVTWPSDITGLTKQIGVNGVYTNNIDEIEVTENGSVVAQLIDSDLHIVKKARVTITNIDNVPPAEFSEGSITVAHTIANYITLQGSTTDADKYYFSKDNGTTWVPSAGLTTGKYTFTDVTPNSTVALRMKAADQVGNERLSYTISQRTFKPGIEILAGKFAGTGVSVDTEKNLITLPDGRIFILTLTPEGSYAVKEIPAASTAEVIASDEATLNAAIAEFEKTETKTIAEILEHLRTSSLGDVDVTAELIITHKMNYYRIVTNADGSHTVVFKEIIEPNGLTSSGQVEEQELVEKIQDLVNQKALENNTSIMEILNAAIEQGLLLAENVNKNTGTFECTNGNTYQIMVDEGGSLFVDLIGTSASVENAAIADKILEKLADGIKNTLIDWAIADGITTEELSVRADGEYETLNGSYIKIDVDFETGLYSSNVTTKPDGAKISYTLTPDFPEMTNKTVLNATATYAGGVSKIELISELGDVLATSNSGNMTYDITNNGKYIIRATTVDNKVTEKQILISNISTLLPIKVTIIPESARNTSKTETQNGIETGPITVVLQYSDAQLLTNTDKYQYKMGDAGSWVVSATSGNPVKDVTIEGITENSVIYARYFDGEKGLKEVKIVIDTVDNVAPDAFDINPILTSHSITVEGETTDKAADSNGTASREGIGQILRYEYSLDGTNWQENKIFSDLDQNTEYTVYAKAIDYAGNETVANNSGATFRTTTVPAASAVASISYSTTELTNEAVTVTVNIDTENNPNYDLSNSVQYQILPTGSTEAALVEANWETGAEFDVLNNCVIFVRIADVRGQVNPAGGYLQGSVQNIDNLVPDEFTPVVTARTQTTLTVMAADKAALEEGSKVSAKDAAATSESLSSGMDKYTYYLIPSSGDVQKFENVTEGTYTFEDLTAGKAYAVYIEASDKAGNVRISDQITTSTNAKVGEKAEITTTIYGIMEDAGYNNPVIPGGFKAVNTDTATWGDDRTLTAQYDNGLLLEDEEGNQFIWVPVDGTNVAYQKWMTTGIDQATTTDGDNPVAEQEQIAKYEGFYIGRYETGNEGGTAVSKAGATVKSSIRYENAKAEAEKMYAMSSNSVYSGLVTGTQWDTLMKWISNSKTTAYVTTDTTWGNYSGSKIAAGTNNNYQVKNIYDLSGNVREITNEFQGTYVVVRGGAFDAELAAGNRGIIGREFQPVNVGYRTVLYVAEKGFNGDPVFDPYAINPGPNRTINNLAPSYNNPVLPAGFKCVNTTDASWAGVTPNGWNKGLVIEDSNGNQFVWVPVDGTVVKYQKGTLVWQSGTEASLAIAGDDLPEAVIELGDNERTQIEEYGGFYVARYEAGNEEGSLASKAGLKTVNALDYATAKQYAERMYNTPYVKSGLLTGTSWDAMTSWIENAYGNTYVTKNTSTGNSYYNKLTFTGDYAIGPNSPSEVRGAYNLGENVTKPAKTSYLLGTGLVEAFKTKNIYDLAGNVWEYTSEYYTMQGENVHIARGSDYYRKENTTWGIKIREGISAVTGEARNEGGFRVMLYLSEKPAEVGVFEDYNRTMDGQNATYKNPIIPAGFAPVNKGADWGNGKTIAPDYNNGLVIEDQAGNQFVWVPVDNTNVKYQKWTTRGITYADTTGDVTPAVLSTWKVNEGSEDPNALTQDETTQILKYGGFYVSRYEASQSENGTAMSVEGQNPWVDLTWAQAKEKAEAMIQTDKTATGLITGTQWDTLLRWIANEKGEEAILTDSTNWGNYSNSGLGRNASAKNIYEIAGGSWEWTAEQLGDGKIFRGGVKTDSGSSAPAAYRGAYTQGDVDANTGFRTVLYITGKVEGMVKQPVQEGAALKGTEFPAAVNAPVLTSELTPVKWSGTTWVKTTATDPEWYSYVDADASGITAHNTSRWANAMTPDGTIFVWVPRYAYKITYNNPNSISSGGTIDVVFLQGTTNIPQSNVRVFAQATNNITTTTDYIVHPAFRNDASIGGWDRELPGIWVAKNEMGASHDKQGGSQFASARAITLGMTETQKARVDTHMAKNSEWGAAAYLSVSKYGSGKSNSATTTGNEYGIYGMAGGNLEYTASYYSNILPGRVSNIYEIRTAPAKYKTVYGSYYGDAFNETARWDGSGHHSPRTYWWDHGFPRPLFVRGNSHSGGANTVFATSVQCSNTNYSYSYRLIMIPEA